LNQTKLQFSHGDFGFDYKVKSGFLQVSGISPS